MFTIYASQLKSKGRVLFLLMFMLSLLKANAQTTLISPTGDGGFENGTTYSANGWTVDNGTQTNKWELGTAAGGHTGNRAAYVSADGGTSYSYNLTATSVVHFYRDIVFPAGETDIRLIFKFKGGGESTLDRIRVYLVPTSTTPVAGTELTSGQIGATNINTNNSTTNGNGTSSFTIIGMQIPGANAGTTQRLVFSWRNDASAGAAPGAIEDIELISRTALALSGTYTIDNTIAASGTNFTSFNSALLSLNINGISSAVTFNVPANRSFTEVTPAITATGTVSNTITFQKSGTGNNPVINANGLSSLTTDAGITISGGDFITFDGIDIALDNASSNTSVEYGYLIRNAAATNGAKNNTIKNCTITLNRTNTNSRGILQSATTTGGGVSATATTGTNDNNVYENLTVSNCYYGVHMLGTSTTFPDLNNRISGTTQGAFTVGSSTANDIGNGSSLTAGILVSTQLGLKIYNCTIRNVTHTSTSTVDGISLTSVGSNGTTHTEVYNNIIFNIRGTSTTSTGGISGIRFISNLSTGTHDVRTFNNVIYGITSGYTGTASATRSIRGIILGTSGSTTYTYRVYNNSVQIDGSSTPNISSVCLELGTTTCVNDIKNNIFSNTTGSQTSPANHSCIYGTSTTSIGATGSASDYNCLYIANTTQGFIGWASTTSYATLAGWQGATPARDANSTASNPNFNSATNLIPTSAGSLTGTTLGSPYNLDILGVSRTVPRMGAYENIGDYAVPTISYTALSNQGASNFTTTSFATITDVLSGVDGNTGTRPRLYYKKSTDANTFGANNSSTNGWKWVEANGSSSPFDFTVDYSLINGGSVSLNDVIQYFVVAQDLATTPNVGSNPSTGFAGTSVSSITSAPTTPNSFTIVNPPMSGNYNVGASQTAPNYTTLTSAITDLNLRGVSGAITFTLMDANYSTSETFPLVINQIGGASSTNTITIKPGTGVNATITGSSSSALIRLNGTDYLTIDGSNNSSSSRNLTITNTSALANTAVIMLSSLGAGAGATNNTIKNCKLFNGSTAVVNYGISIGGATAGTSGADNDNCTIQNNTFATVTTGIYANGTAASSSGGLDNLGIFSNSISFVATTDGCYGIRVGNALTSTIESNTVDIETSLATMVGISLETGFISSTVNKNYITKVKATSASALPVLRGITISTGQTASAVTISNNIITNVIANYATTNAASNCTGLMIGAIGVSTTTTNATGGVNLYFNSIHLSGSVNRASAVLQYGLFIGANASSLDIRNNVISNTIINANASPSTSKSYAVYSNATNAAYSNMNNNCYFVGATQGVLGYIASADATSLSAFQTAFGQNASSISSDPLFNSNSILAPVTGSPLLGAGVQITGFTTDYVGANRNNPPSIGAYENAGDYTPPTISYTNLVNTSSTSNRTVSAFATITDPSGVNTTSGTRPRIYFKKKTDTDAFVGNTSSDNGWKWVEASNTTSPFDFTLDYSIINGGSVTVGDTIHYFVVAQDNGAPTVGANPSTGFVGTTVSSITTAPSTPNFYVISNAPLSGTYIIGSSQSSPNYTTITAAIADLNVRGVSGAVTFNLADASYSTGETFPIVIRVEGPEPTATNTVTIKPATSVTSVITGSAGSLIQLFSPYIIIDGSNNGTTTKDLTIDNTSTATNSTPLVLNNNSLGKVAKNCTIKNSIIKAGTNTTTSFGIILNSGAGDYDNTVIQNNTITKCYYGVVVQGSTAINTNDVQVIDNIIGSTTAADAIGLYGIYLIQADNTIISGNDIYGDPAGSSPSGKIGIYVLGTTTNTKIRRNKIHDWITTSTTGSCWAIQAANTATTGTTEISNNLIYAIRGNGSNITAGAHSAGIYVSSGATGSATNLYYNSVYMNGSALNGTSTASASSCLTVSSGVVGMDVRNNIFHNAQTGTGTTRYTFAVNVQGTASPFTTSNYNVYYVNGDGANTGYYNGSFQSNLAAWKSASSVDNNTVAGDPLFNSITNLIPQPNSSAIAGGTPIGGITTDYVGNSRNVSTPYIGAYESNVDASAPIITFTNLPNHGSVTSRTTSGFATITDPGAGLNTTSGTRPRLYFKKSTDANAFVGNTSSDNGWKWVEANNTTSPFDFTINYSIINGGSVSATDVINYFVVAQDLNTTPNVSANPSVGFAGTSVSSISAAPTTPNSYTILSPLGTNITVGTGGASPNYPSLTGTGGLFEAINNGVLGGNTTVTIVANLSESGTYGLIESGMGGFTLNIVPDGTTIREISNSTDLTQAMIRIEGADNVTIDGRFSGSGNYLRFVNTHTTAGSCQPTIQINSSSTGINIRNASFESNASTTTLGTVTLGTGTNSVTLISNIVRDAIGTPGTIGVPANAIYNNNSSNTLTIGGSTAADGNEIFNFTTSGINLPTVANGVNIQNNQVYQTAPRSTTTTNILVGGGSNHTINSNKIYITSGSYTGTFTGISITGSTNGHTVNNNSIGGGAANRSGNALSSTTTINGITLTVGTTVATSVQGNTFSNIGSTSSGVNGINATAGNINIGTITGNIFGGLANAYDTIRNGSDNGIISYSGTGTVTIENNTIGNVAYYKSGGDRTAGIYFSSSATAIIRNNTIRDISSNVTTTSFTSSFLLSGIHIAGTISSSSIIENNTIYNITNTNTGTAAYIAQGIHLVSSSSGATVKRNRIYGIKADGTGTGTSSPYVFGIFTRGGAANFVNNQISVGSGVGNEVRVIGVYMNGTGAENFYYNSVYVTGTTASGTNKTYAFFRGSSSTSGTKNMLNNIFFNDRTGGTGGHFAIGTSSTTGWASVTSNYNLLVSGSASTIGDYAGTAYNFTNWQTTAVEDANSASDITSNVSAANLFTATSSGNLNIATGNTASWWVNGRGVQIVGQTEDYGSTSAARSTSLAGGGTDIGSDEFSPTINPPDVTVSGSHTNSGTETFTFAGRPVASITWGASGTLPTFTGYKYWPGTWPNDVTNNSTVTGARYFNAYWVINATGGSGYTYDLTLNYDDALLGTISSESNVRMAKKQTGVNGTWTSFNSNTTLNTTNNTMTVTGLTDFSEFTGNENANPLPVEWLSFTGKPAGEHVELKWTTATEINNSHFVVERSTDARTFTAAGEVNGAGNSNSTLNYTFVDVDAFGTATILYYRLKQVDFDGAFEYSNVIAVSKIKQIGNGVTIEAINPNPFTQDLKLQLNNVTEGDVTVEVFDLSGRKHYTTTQVSEQGTLTLDLSSLSTLAKGVYILNVHNGGTAIQQKLVKLQ